ncbi:MAG TPA: trypsin-like peptidase domain-containing protein, partial [Blastocatellia bacterium]|nr:trypsin-like peptidase domain-containing protein [Blastocatellia bacterium]
MSIRIYLVKRFALKAAGSAALAVLLAPRPGVEAICAVRPAQLDKQTRESVRRIIPAVGIIFARNSSDPPGEFPRLRGSGVVIRQDGIVVTNYHVIRHDDDEKLYDEIYLSLPALASGTSGQNSRFRVKVAEINRQYDLALLKITSDNLGRSVPPAMAFPAIEFADSRKVKPMDELIIIGYPGKAGADVTVNKGMVEGIDTVNEWIKTDARLMRGNSGGAGVDREGRLVGIPSKVIVDIEPRSRENDDDTTLSGAVGFLRPSNLVAAMLRRIGGPAPLDTPVERPRVKAVGESIIVRGRVTSASNGIPVAGARIGIVPPGTETVTADNLIAWGGTDSEGRFELNNRVP